MIANTFYKHKETILNFSWRSLQLFGKQGITLFTFILCAKFLTPYDFGVYNYILAVVFFLIILGDFGISTAVSKYTAEFSVTGKEKVRSLLFNSMLLIMGIGVVVTFVSIILGGSYFGPNFTPLLFAIPLVFLTPLSSLYDGVFRGLKRFKELALISAIVGIVSAPLTFLLVLHFTLLGAIIAQVIFYTVLVVVLALRYGKINCTLDKALLVTVSRYSLVLGFTTLAYFFYTKADVVILGHFGYIEEIGYYELINKIYEIVKMPFLVLSTVLAPSITKYYCLGEYQVVKQKFIRHISVALLAGVILSVLLYFIVPFAIKVFINNYYVAETLLMFNLLLLLLPIRILGSIAIQAHTVATGNAHFSLWTMIPAGILNVFLDIVFINYFGFIGVVYSTLICFTFAILSFLLLYYLKLNRLIRIRHLQEA